MSRSALYLDIAVIVVGLEPQNADVCVRFDKVRYLQNAHLFKKLLMGIKSNN